MGLFFKLKQTTKTGGLKQPILALMSALLCITITPVLAKTPPPASVNQNQPISQPQAEHLIQQGRSLYESEQYNAAIQILLQAAAAFKSSGADLQQAMTLSNLSLSYQKLGQWPEAEQTIQESLDLLQIQENQAPTNDQLQLLAQALDVRGRLHFARGQAQSALTTWQQATETYTQLKDDPGIIRSHIHQAKAMQELGLNRKAQTTLTELQPTLQTQPDNALKASGLRSIGDSHRVMGNLKASQKSLEQALEVTKTPQAANEKYDILLSLGHTAQAQQNSEVALAYYQKAATSHSPITRLQAQMQQLSLLLTEEKQSEASALLTTIRLLISDIPPTRTTLYAQITLAQHLIDSDLIDTQEITQLLTKAIQQAESLGDARAKSSALGSLGHLYEQTQQSSAALELTQQALSIAESIQAPDIAYRWQWQLGRLRTTQGEQQSAIAAYSEAILNLQTLRQDLVAIDSEVQFSFRESVEPVYRQLVELLLQNQATDQFNQKNLIAARNTIEDLQLAELDNYFREACLDPLEEIDSVDPKAAIFYPILLSDRLEVILSLPGQPLRHYPTPVSPAKVEHQIQALQQKIVLPYTSEEKEITPLSQEIYRWLIQPAEAALSESNIETLVFVPDGPLRGVPLSTLHDGHQYLIEKYNVALTPGLRLFEPKPLTNKKLNALTAGLTQERFGFLPLEHVERELSEIEAKIPSQTLLDQKFTTANLDRRVTASPSPVVHIATHGQFSSQPEETFILAWDQRINVNQLDNLLRTRERNRPDAIELLVLSACETAEGDERAALGLAGVAVRAGARSTLASLWVVDDASTAQLMSDFYTQLETGASKAAALRHAQLQLLQGDYHHPRFWSAFVLLGNWL